jgi:hypothetical protein
MRGILFIFEADSLKKDLALRMGLSFFDKKERASVTLD